MSSWKECKLGDVISSISETYKFTNEKVVFLNTSDVYLGKILNKNEFNPKDLPGQAKKRIKKNDLLFSEIRPANGRYAFVVDDAENYVVSTKLMVLRSSENILPSFLNIFLTSKDMLEYLQMLAEDRSGTFPQITFDNISNIDISLPSLEEQKAIAEVLSSLDDKIDLLHRQNQTLESLAQTLFRQWFIEEAKEEWEIGTLNDLVEVSSGKSLKRELFDDTGKYEVLGANGKIGKTNEWLFEEKLIYTGRVGTLGKVFLIDEVKKVWLSDNTLIIKPKRYFYFIYFLMIEFNFEEFNVGSTQPLIRQSDLKNIEILLPNDKLILKFEEQAKDIFIKINKNKKQIQTLENLRDTLLPNLLSGEVRVEI